VDVKENYMELYIATTDYNIIERMEKYFQETYSINIDKVHSVNSTSFRFPDNFTLPPIREITTMFSIPCGYRPIISKTVIEPITQEYFISIVDIAISTKIKEYGYDSIVSACSYSNSNIQKFKEEGIAFSNWRDALWAYCFQLLEQVTSGAIQAPEPDIFLQNLPKFEDYLVRA
jgi:hypothetical protein